MTTYTLLPTYDHDTDEWHEQRQRSIGASESAAILRMSPWQTPLDVYMAKKGQRVGIPDNLAYWGNNLEDAVAKWVHDYHPEIGFILPGLSVAHADYPFITATLDRRIEALEGIIPVELKTASIRSRDDHWTVDGVLQVPTYYQVQVQHQMAIVGAPRAYVAVLFGGNDAHLFTVKRDDEFIDTVLIPRLADFWVNHVEAGIPPEPESLADLATLYPHDPGSTLVGSELVMEAVDRRAVLLSDIKAMQEEVDALTFTIGAYMGEAETLLDPDGVPVLTYRLQAGRKTVSVSDVQERYPELVDSLVRVGKPFKVMRKAGKQ